MTIDTLNEYPDPKTRALLTLQALFEGKLGSGFVSRGYVIEKIETVMELEEPERVLDVHRLKRFEELLKEHERRTSREVPGEP